MSTKFWSCKIKRPETLKGHRLLRTATDTAGDHGFVYDSSIDCVYQVHEMANGRLRRFDTRTQPERCNTGGFDMRAAMASADIEARGGWNTVSTVDDCCCKELGSEWPECEVDG